MANYKPNTITISASAGRAASGSVLHRTLSTTTWGLYLLDGTAVTPGNVPISSGTVRIWLSNTTGAADYETFSDSNAYYAITLPVINDKTYVKFYQ